MSIYAASSDAFSFSQDWGDTGLVGTLTVTIYDGDIVVSAGATSGVNEIASSGSYVISGVAPSDSGTYQVLVGDGLATISEDLIVTASYSPSHLAPLAGHYTSPSALRTKLGVDISALGDEAASDLIEDAEDIVDGMLGARAVDAVTGRKVVEAQVLTAQFRKITRATLKVAAKLYEDASLGDRVRFRREKGPDFEVEDALGGVFGTTIPNLVNSSGLAVLTTRASGGGVPNCNDRAVRTNSDSDEW